MKLTELLVNQRITIQLLWGEQKIEFFSNVLDVEESAVYVTPYLHNGSVLEIDVNQGKGVICNLFTNEPNTKHRISWKNVELTTVKRNDENVYCLKTNSFNQVAKHDDRRLHTRYLIKVNGTVQDSLSEEPVNIIVHDISDIGISFYAPTSFMPKSNQLVVSFQDTVDDKLFEVKVECGIARITNRAGNRFVGCKITKENRDYQLYGFMVRLMDKNR